MAVHIGQAILSRLESLGMPKVRFAERIGMNKSNVHDVFKRPGCDTVMLRKISQVLEFNFFKLLSDDLEPASATSMVSEPMVRYQRLPARSPMRIVIEVDPNDPEAKGEAERMAERLLSRKPKPKG